MKKTNKNKVKEFIRVDHAGERGAVKIYEGQLLALNTLIKDEDLKKKIEEIAKDLGVDPNGVKNYKVLIDYTEDLAESVADAPKTIKDLSNFNL